MMQTDLTENGTLRSPSMRKADAKNFVKSMERAENGTRMSLSASEADLKNLLLARSQQHEADSSLEESLTGKEMC